MLFCYVCGKEIHGDEEVFYHNTCSQECARIMFLVKFLNVKKGE